MPLEVEMKAWVDNPVVLRSRLESAYTLIKKLRKEDVYFQKDGALFKSREPVRLRKNGDCWQVTFKKRAMHEGMEINDEHEFEVSDPAEFQKLMNHLNMVPYVEKIKDSEVFAGPEKGLTLELNHLHTLGWFLEIEWLVEEDRGLTPSAMKKRLSALYEELGITSEKLESRYYTDMLLNGV